MRDSNGKFLKGYTGNAGGRPAELAGVRDAAKTHTTRAVAVLARIMEDEAAPPAARTAAATALLDRAWGRPGQSLEMKIDGTDPSQAHIEAIRQMALRRKAEALDPAVLEPPKTH